MDAARRRRYLTALGIERWTPRPGFPATVEVAASPISEPAAILESAVEMAIVEPPPLFTPPADPVATADWATLETLVAGCERCRLCETRTRTVFGVGDRNAPLLVIGEGPGADEDAQGEPFVGRAGKLLDEMLRAIGRSRRGSTPEAAVYIANIVKCRPPGNREPQPDEAAACRPYLERQLELLRPRLIVAAGRVAAQRLLESTASLSAMRGPIHQYGPTAVRVLVTYHPAYLLRAPADKAKSWLDLKRVYRILADPMADGALSETK